MKEKEFVVSGDGKIFYGDGLKQPAYDSVRIWSKIISYLLLAPLMALVATSCDKDEDGYYLSSVYTTASYDGINYIDRQKSAVPGIFLGIPSPDSQLLTNSSTISDSDIFPVLFITTLMKPVDENMQQLFQLNIYLRNIEPGKDLKGREFNISSSDYFTRDKKSEALSIIARDKIDVVAMYYYGQYMNPKHSFLAQEHSASQNTMKGTIASAVSSSFQLMVSP